MKRILPILAAAAVILGLLVAPGRAIAQSCAASYTVAAGDTLWSIARRCGVTVQAIASANTSITNTGLIYVGQVLADPGGTGDGGVPVTGGPYTQYTVKPGDYLRAIAAQNGVTFAALVAANPNIANYNLIYPGMVLNIPPGVPVTGGAQRYTVLAGDTLMRIAQKMNTSVPAIVAKNPEITNMNLIYVGQVLVMP